MADPPVTTFAESETFTKAARSASAADWKTTAVLAEQLDPKELAALVMRLHGGDLPSLFAAMRGGLMLTGERKIQERLSSAADRLTRVGIGLAIVGVFLAAPQLLVGLGVIRPARQFSPVSAAPLATPSAAPASAAPTAAAPTPLPVLQTPPYTTRGGRVETAPASPVGTPRARADGAERSPPKP
jgi:hypothetical protein